jgi:CheY-like chemotaxis protein
MPEMNGIEATKRIKDMFPDLPVIAQTAYAMAGDTEKIKLAGFDDYISKPLDIKKLMSMLNSRLKNNDAFPAVDTNKIPLNNKVTGTV